jgi:hypothetical protein
VPSLAEEPGLKARRREAADAALVAQSPRMRRTHRAAATHERAPRRPASPKTVPYRLLSDAKSALSDAKS